MTNAISIQHLNKTYIASGKSPAKVALTDVSLDIPQGSVFALLGPNGAGKSTLINILAGLVNKSSGTVNVWGYDLDKDARAIRSCLGIVPQELNFDPFFTPLQILDLQAGLYGVPKSERNAMQILTNLGLADKAHAYTRQLSGGMRRRVMVAKAMVHNPPILILDEPTAGVDIELRQQLWHNVRALNAAGTTVILTTHYLEEAQELCDRIAIINHGRVVANEDKKTLLNRIESKDITFTFAESLTEIPATMARYNARLVDTNTLTITFAPRDIAVGQIIHDIQAANLCIRDVNTQSADLEDVFLQLTQTR